MNAAARLVHQHVLTRHLLWAQILTWRQMASLFLLLAVIVSSVATIYITHTTRIMYANYQHYSAEKNRLEIEQSQLLLERSTLLVRARAQDQEHHLLGMVKPSAQSIVVVGK